MFGYTHSMNGGMYGASPAMSFGGASSVSSFSPFQGAFFSPFQALAPLAPMWSQSGNGALADHPMLVPAFMDATSAILDGYSNALDHLSSAFRDAFDTGRTPGGESADEGGNDDVVNDDTSGDDMTDDGADVEAPSAEGPGERAENVILMVPDGFGPAYAESFRTFKDGEELPAWEASDMLTGAIKTASADAAVTDSAAAGTAFATGQKTDNGRVSTAPDGTDLTTLVDLAEAAGKSTGVVATSTVTHATPAVFGANVASRHDQDLIAEQFINDDKLDVILGGGRDYFLSEEDGGEGVANLLEQAQSQGFDVLGSQSELEGADGDRLLGLFADGALDTSFGESGSDQPTLADMTDKALETLSKDEDGFFLMVEGSQIDWAGHANDGAWAMHDTAAFEDALVRVQEFSEENPDTLVVIAPDHETGGMINAPTGEQNASVLQGFTGTYGQIFSEAADRIEAAGMDYDNPAAGYIMQATVAEMSSGEVVLSQEEVAGVLAAEDESAMLGELGAVLNEHAGISFHSGYHTAVDVPLYAAGTGAELFEGLLDNTEVAHNLARAMGVEFPAGQQAEVTGVSDMAAMNEMVIA